MRAVSCCFRLFCLYALSCVVFDCYARSRCLVFCSIVSFVRTVLFCVGLLRWFALSCVVFECYFRACCACGVLVLCSTVTVLFACLVLCSIITLGRSVLYCFRLLR